MKTSNKNPRYNSHYSENCARRARTISRPTREWAAMTGRAIDLKGDIATLLADTEAVRIMDAHDRVNELIRPLLDYLREQVSASVVSNILFESKSEL